LFDEGEYFTFGFKDAQHGEYLFEEDVHDEEDQRDEERDDDDDPGGTDDFAFRAPIDLLHFAFGGDAEIDGFMVSSVEPIGEDSEEGEEDERSGPLVIGTGVAVDRAELVPYPGSPGQADDAEAH